MSSQFSKLSLTETECNATTAACKNVSNVISMDTSPISEPQIDCNTSDNNKHHVNYLGVRVVNLSDHKLNKSEYSLLEKGITFAPTPGEADIAEIHTEVHRFIRRILLKVFFYDDSDDNDQVDNSYKSAIPKGLLKFKPASTWTPKTTDPTIRAFVHNVQSSLSALKPCSGQVENLTKNEKKSMVDLKDNRNIIIKKADKGSSIVVMNRTDYIKEAERQLSDTKFYKEVDNDLTEQHNNEIESLLGHLYESELITEPIFKCLTNKNPKTASLYLLPKIHKIKERGQFPAGRPIISANQSPTERISAFVDENIKQALPLIPSYIKDTTHFISLVESTIIPNDCLLVTLDVTSLYTNIPNEEGISAVAKSLETNKPPFTRPQIVLRLLRMVLTKNNFSFNGRDYLQVGGTAMGTKLAPSYANIFMGELEQKLIDSSPKEPFFWKRFIDDIFMIWTHGEEELHKFLEYLNTAHQQWNILKIT